MAQTLDGQDFSIIFVPKKRVNYKKPTFATKQRKLYFHIINIIQIQQMNEERERGLLLPETLYDYVDYFK